MRCIDKPFAYSRLTEIKRRFGVDTREHIKEVAMSESVPYETLVFINKYLPIDQLSVYNRIYESRKKNPLYRTLLSEDLSDIDKAIALSSLITQSLIVCKKNEDKEYKDILKLMNVDVLTEALEKYAYDESTEKLNEVCGMVREMFNKLYREDRTK